MVKKPLLLIVLLATALTLTAQSLPQLTADSQASGSQQERNIDDVLHALTLEEKISLIVGGRNDNQPAEGAMIGSTGKLVHGAAGITNAVPRLGIQPTVFTDGPAGVRISAHRPGEERTYYATAFPVGTCLASTWDTGLVEQLTAAMGQEVLEYGCDVLLAPGMNIHRNPLCGRNFEYFSEDPVLAGQMAAAYVRGVQQNGVGTSVKHYAVNNQETQRTQNDARVSQRALREIYLKPFEIAIREAKPWTVMSSYNKVNGPLVQEDPYLLTTILRDEWGFDGVVVTDWTGTRNTVQQLIAGNDILEPGNNRQAEDLLKAANDGTLPMEVIDRAVRRILQYIVKTPRQKGYRYSDQPDLEGHARLVRELAAEGMVLLKNNGVLPIKSPGAEVQSTRAEVQSTRPDAQSPNAEALSQKPTVALFGITSYDLIPGGRGSGSVNKAYTVSLAEGLTDAGYTLTPDLRQLYEDYRGYAYSKLIAEDGKNWYWGKPTLQEMPLSRKVVERQVRQADLAIVTLGRCSDEAKDRPIDGDFDLTATERQLLTDVCNTFHAEGKQVVVVLNVGGVVETASWKALPDAILLAWQPGQEGGHTIADVLTGRTCPSGKLPATFPISCLDHPSSRNFPLTGGTENMGRSRQPRRNIEYTDYEEGIYVGYRHFLTHKAPVSYPFGFGLSYTTFAYTRPTVKPVKGGFEASVTVTNTGQTAGKEAVQLYVSAPKSHLDKPEAELKAFAKTRLLVPGESQTLTFPMVTHYDLASYDEQAKAWVTDDGTYQIRFAADAETVRQTATYRVGKTERK